MYQQRYFDVCSLHQRTSIKAIFVSTAFVLVGYDTLLCVVSKYGVQQQQDKHVQQCIVQCLATILQYYSLLCLTVLEGGERSAPGSTSNRF